MHRVRLFFFLMVFGAPKMFAGSMIFPQEPPASSLLESKPKPELASLTICLRLEDETPFLGTANVRVMPIEGYEIIGAPLELQGEFLFSDVTPGKYIVEVNAPGYLAVRLSTEVEAGRRRRTMFVVMKPRLAAKQLEKMEQPDLTSTATTGTKTEPAATTGISPAPGTRMERDYWRPHELEEVVPLVDASVACPTQEVLLGVEQRMSEFVSTLEKFTATENVVHYKIDQAGARKGPETRNFAYVVVVTQHESGTFMVDEFRDGSTDIEQFPAHFASLGLPAIDLIFHPLLATDFDFRCEGLGQWEGREAWQVHFVQRADRPVRIRSYRVGARSFPVWIEGRVWIDPGNNQIIRLESELAKPIPEIELTREHVTIDYQPVRFRSTGQQIWLPHIAEMYVERKNKRFSRRHTFTDFRLFNVDTAQSIQAPKGSYSFVNTSDRDVTGELTVMPEAGARLEAVKLRFTVPAHGKVFKVVGPGKDVNLPAAAVGSATFVHNGEAGSVKVDALLVKETTLDVLP